MTTPHDNRRRTDQLPGSDDFFDEGGPAGPSQLSSQFKGPAARRPGTVSQFRLPATGGSGVPPQLPSQVNRGGPAAGHTFQTPSQPLPTPSRPLTSGFQDASWLNDSRSNSSVSPPTGQPNSGWLTDPRSSSISPTGGQQNASWPTDPRSSSVSPPTGQPNSGWLTDPRSSSVSPSVGLSNNAWLTDSQYNVSSAMGQQASQPAHNVQSHISPTTGQQNVSWLADAQNSNTTTGQRNAVRWWLDEDAGESQPLPSQPLPQWSPAQTDGRLMVPWGLPSVTTESQAVSPPDQAISGQQQSVTWNQGATAMHGAVAPQQMITTGQQGAITWGVPVVPYAPPSQNAYAWNNMLATGESAVVTWERPAEEAMALPEAPAREPEDELPRLERYTPMLAFLLNVSLVVLILLAENTGAFVGVTSKLWPGGLHSSLNDITKNQTMSPLLFGTNMALFHDWDESMLKSAATRQMLKDIGVRVIRMPTRDTLKDETQIAAANAIKAVGAVPLVVLNGPEYKTGDLLTRNKHLMDLIGGVFGNQPVYYEFGNESDLQGISAEQYAQTWNQVVPQLKQISPRARFIGPDMYQFNRRYLKTFVQNAKPRPDGVSWHEYTCSVHWSADFCLANIDSWPMHFAQARAAMREAIGTELPIWISEYNYASDQALDNDQPINDGKLNNPAFMNAWMRKAMQTLADGHLYAALQYYATNPAMPLITSDGDMGIEGKIFQQNYQKIIVGGYTPVQSSGIIPAPALKPGTKVAVSFEGNNTSGWASTGGGISQTSITTAKAFDGKQSLRATLTNEKESDTPYISTTVDKLPSVPKAGQMIHAYVFVANPKALVNAKLFVGDPGGNWYYTNDTTLTSGQWNHLWYALPTDFNGTAATLGIQFYTAKPGVSSDVYVDDLYW